MAVIVTPGIPCLLFAVRRESQFFRRDCRSFRRLPAPCPAYFGGPPSSPLLVLETGVGRAAVESALDWVQNGRVQPSFILYAGFAGALDAGLHIGDVLLADTIVDPAGRAWPATWPGPFLVEPTWVQRGRLLTAAQLVASAEDKRRLGALHRARAVDMEAACAVARCTQYNIPFGCIRAISDTVDTTLSPSLVALLSGSRVSLPGVLAALFRKPKLLPELWRLGRDTQFASRQLAMAVRELLNLPASPKSQNGAEIFQDGGSGKSQDAEFGAPAPPMRDRAENDDGNDWPWAQK